MTQIIDKFTEAEIAWLMRALSSGDCKSCIWQDGEQEKYRCFPSGEAPCKVFADRVFHGLEISGLI